MSQDAGRRYNFSRLLETKGYEVFRVDTIQWNPSVFSCDQRLLRFGEHRMNNKRTRKPLCVHERWNT
jgi:hypothetical protein